MLVDGNAILYGYLTQGELDFAIHEEGLLKDDEAVDLQEGIMSKLVDRTPLKISAKAPMKYAVEMFEKLGLWHWEGCGSHYPEQLVLYLEGLHH